MNTSEPTPVPEVASSAPSPKAAKPAAKPAAKKGAAPARVAKKPAVKAAVKAPATQKATPAKAPQVASQAAPKPSKSAKPVKAVKPAKPVKPPKAAKPEKIKIVRDSFTMPEADFALIDQIKQRALGWKQPAKKSEVLRAALQALQALPDAKLRQLLAGLAPIKKGRPQKTS